MRDEIYPLGDGRHALIRSEVIAAISKYRQAANYQPESGGILLGRRTISGHLEVTSCTEPSIHDKRRRFTFFRARQHHQMVARQRWANTQGKTDYIGEWHTHPEKHPTPSAIDVNAWRKIVKDTGRSPYLVIIMGTASHWVGLIGADALEQINELQAKS